MGFAELPTSPLQPQSGCAAEATRRGAASGQLPCPRAA